MTQEQTIATIRAEIERMHQEAVLTAIGNETEWLRSRIGTLVDIMAFLSTFEADHTPLPEDTVLFNKGVEEGKRLMMEEARNHFVLSVLSENHTKKMIELYNDEVDCKAGDVVRAIIFKKED